MFIPDPDFFPSWILDPDLGFKGQKSTGSRIRIRNTGYQMYGMVPYWDKVLTSGGRKEGGGEQTTSPMSSPVGRRLRFSTGVGSLVVLVVVL